MIGNSTFVMFTLSRDVGLKFHQDFDRYPEVVILSHASLWTPSRVHVDPSLGTDTYSLYTPYILLIYSSWTPDGLYQDVYFSRTPNSLLLILKQESRRTPPKLHKYSANLNLIYNVIKKTNFSSEI